MLWKWQVAKVTNLYTYLCGVCALKVSLWKKQSSVIASLTCYAVVICKHGCDVLLSFWRQRRSLQIFCFYHILITGRYIHLLLFDVTFHLKWICFHAKYSVFNFLLTIQKLYWSSVAVLFDRTTKETVKIQANQGRDLTNRM